MTLKDALTIIVSGLLNVEGLEIKAETNIYSLDTTVLHDLLLERIGLGLGGPNPYPPTFGELVNKYEKLLPKEHKIWQTKTK